MRRALALVVVALAAGCGNERTQPLDVSVPAEPNGAREVVLRKARLSFEAPRNWQDIAPTGSLIGGVRSSRATVAVWRYQRAEPLPATEQATREARDLLLKRVEQRDPTFDLEQSRVRRRRIELLGRGRIHGNPVAIRSLHLFSRGAEVVIDAYAPREQFDRLDRTVFRPLLESVRVR